MTLTSHNTAVGTADASKIAKWAPLAVILCGTFVYVLDFFVVNVALPDIQRSLQAGPDAIEWVVAGYGLTSASFLVCGGRRTSCLSSAPSTPAPTGSAPSASTGW